MNLTLDRFRGALIGLAAGDALGTTLEFSRRDSRPPVSAIVGGGPFHLEPGQWTDDTSMAICLAESLVETGGFDPLDQRVPCSWPASHPGRRMRRPKRWMRAGTSRPS